MALGSGLFADTYEKPPNVGPCCALMSMVGLSVVRGAGTILGFFTALRQSLYSCCFAAFPLSLSRALRARSRFFHLFSELVVAMKPGRGRMLQFYCLEGYVAVDMRLPHPQPGAPLLFGRFGSVHWAPV